MTIEKENIEYNDNYRRAENGDENAKTFVFPCFNNFLLRGSYSLLKRFYILE